MNVNKIAVIGAGSMGRQISMLCALGGYETVLQDINEENLSHAEEELNTLMKKWEIKKKISNNERKKALKKLQYTTNLRSAVEDRDIIIEAVVEDINIKKSLFEKLDKLSPKHTILATNSSTIVNSALAEVTNRKDQVINMHFFYPPLIMDCVEVVKSKYTSKQTTEVILEVCKKINRSAFLLEKEISGFVANRLLGALEREAMDLYEKGIADFKDIDQICRKALNHPLGPFEIADLSGIDIIYNVMKHQYLESQDPRLKPPLFLKEKVESGELGRKSGKGFYQYNT